MISINPLLTTPSRETGHPRGRDGSLPPEGYVFSVAAGILPAVEPGILPGGMGVWFEKALPFRTSGPGGKMPPSTAAKMAAATDVYGTLNTCPEGLAVGAGAVCRSKGSTALPLNRRQFIRTGGGALAAAALITRLEAGYAKLKIGAPDWNLKLEAKPASIELAKNIGFDGVQISLGHSSDSRNPPAHLPVSTPDLFDQFLTEARKNQLPIASTCVEILHRNYLKNDPLGKQWVAESIPLTRKLGARVILLPFFGKGALQTRAEMDYVGDFLKEIGPEAEKTGVILGLENTISAEDNARILDRAQSKAVLVYYDVGNSFNNGFDIYKEIGWLGKDRICEFHLKDNPNLLGQGKIDFPKVIGAIVETGFSGWAQLETVAPSGDVSKDMKANLDYVRGLLAKA